MKRNERYYGKPDLTDVEMAVLGVVRQSAPNPVSISTINHSVKRRYTHQEIAGAAWTLVDKGEVKLTLDRDLVVPSAKD